MRKKVTAVFCAAVAAFLCGCQDYRGVDKVSIVAGFSVDKSEVDPSKIHLAFEIIDTTASAEKKGKQTLIVESEGVTIFDAISKGNEQLSRNLYFGNAELIILHDSVAREEGVNNIIEPIIRDYNIRDTMMLIVSRDESAKKILSISPEKEKILSYDVADTLNPQSRSASDVRAMAIYKLYDDIKRNTDSISIPAFELQKNANVETPKIRGLAVFQGDRLAGYLEEEMVYYYLYLCEPLDGGTFAFFMDERPDSDVTLHVARSKPRLSHRVENGRLVLHADVELDVNISGYSPYIAPLDDQMIKAVEKKAAEELNKRILQAVEVMQYTTATDIFGFGTSIYRNDPSYWNTLKDDWPLHFSEAQVEINTIFSVQRTGVLINY